jgi:AraC family transcriptional regulator
MLVSAVRQSSRAFHRVQVARARRFLRGHATEDLALAAVARAAGASPYHFARMYLAITGETVFGTLTRLRIALGAARLCETPARPVSAIALEVGYRTPSSFNKAFRAAFGVSPTAFRATPAAARAAQLAALSLPDPSRPVPVLRLSPRPAIRQRAAWRVIYVREHGDYGDTAAPLAWARLDRCLAGTDAYERFLRVGAAHDDPRIVLPQALRYDAGVLVDGATPVPAGAAAAVWPGGAHAVFEHRGSYRLIAAAFDVIFRDWVARVRLQLRDAPTIELYRNSPATTPEDELLTELWLPIEDTP